MTAHLLRSMNKFLNYFLQDGFNRVRNLVTEKQTRKNKNLSYILAHVGGPKYHIIGHVHNASIVETNRYIINRYDFRFRGKFSKIVN